jgi:signal transduction histidine kinase
MYRCDFYLQEVKMKKRIMIVDDNVDVLHTLKETLEKESFNIETFSNPLDALKKIRASNYDLFLIDLTLPCVSGISFLKMVKKVHKNARYIIMTAYGSTDTVIDAFKAGVSDFILKPFTTEQIVSRIKQQITEKDKIEKKLKKLGKLVESTGIAEFDSLFHDLNISYLKNLNDYEDKLRELSFQYNLITHEKIKKLIKMSGKAKEENNIDFDMLSYVSHEIKAPLHSIISYTRTLLGQCETGNTEYMQEFLNYILTSSMYMLDLSNNLLSSSALYENKLKLHLEPVSISDILKNIRNFLAGKINTKRNVYRENIISGLPIIVADKVKLTQILCNLTDNANKYTENGEVSIDVSLTDDKKSVMFIVKDTGIGIKYKDKSRLFKKFERLQTRNENGVGLGLCITKNLVELHKGKIWVESKFKHGSQFYFTLPLHRAEGSSQEKSNGKTKNFSC